jgi:hypothetical protein
MVIIPWNYLANSGYKPDMKYKNFNQLFTFMAAHDEPNIEI